MLTAATDISCRPGPRLVDCPPYDLHTHTCFSCDSRTSMRAMCRQALVSGLRQIAFTEHVDFVPDDAGRGFFEPAAFLSEVERCRAEFDGQLDVLVGVEIDCYHRFRSEADALVSIVNPDLVIGSLHWAGEELVSVASCSRRPSADELYEEYFQELERMCWGGGFDVLGHLDVVKRHGSGSEGSYEARRYRAFILPILEAIIRHGIALEINTSTLQLPGGEISPDPVIVGWYREMGGDLLTFGSDAHTASGLAAGWSRAVEVARACGFAHWTTFAERSPRPIPLGQR